jgi:CBS domain-containing protein
MLRVRDLMSRKVITVNPATPIKDVARLLVEHDISGMPVVEDGRVVGVISEGDLVVKEQGADAIERRTLERIFGDNQATRAQEAKVAATSAGEAMSAPPITISADAYLSAAAAAMTSRRVNRLPVLEDDELVGILSRSDIVRAFARPDDELAAAVREEALYRTLWLDPDKFEVSVENGTVHIAGQVERRSEKDLIERVTMMVPGVTSVATDVTWQFDDSDIKPPERDLLSPYSA